MPETLEVLFSPAEYAALDRRDLTATVCVVFDVLRATTTMLTALAHGATAIVPVAEIPEALAWRARDPAVLLAGERDGVRIRADRTGGVDFDLGNSPREFTAARVHGRTIVVSTTNGTRALRAAHGARAVWLGGLVNLGAIADRILRERPSHLLLIGAGTLEQAAFEDTLAAGAVCDAVWSLYERGQIADSAAIARQVYREACADLAGAARHSRNGRRLLARPELRDDVAICLRRDTIDFVAALDADGRVRKPG